MIPAVRGESRARGLYPTASCMCTCFEFEARGLDILQIDEDVMTHVRC